MCRSCDDTGLASVGHVRGFCSCRAGDRLVAAMFQPPTARQQRPHDHPSLDIRGDGAEREPAVSVLKDEGAIHD